MKELQATHNESSATLRFGEVTEIDGSNCLVKVWFDDLEMESHWLPVLQHATFGDKTYVMPRKGCQVAALLDPFGEDGVVLGGIYSEADPPPVTDPAKFHKTFDDGTVIEYDTATHKLSADIKGKADIQATGPVTLEAQSVTVKALTVNVEASVTATLAAPLIELDALLVKTSSLMVAGLLQFVPPPPPTP